jgi:HD superfamily phosphohydrolase YqeK
MMTSQLQGILGNIQVHTTDGRGFTPAEIAGRAADKIVYVGQESHPAIRAQAEAFKDNIRTVVEFYLHEAIKSDRTTIAHRLAEAGHPELKTLLID